MTGKDEALPTMLLDGDAAGRKMATDLKNGLYKSAKDHIFTTDKYAGFADSEIEDLFPAKFITEVVDRWQRQADVPFADVLSIGKPIVPQIEAWAKTQSITLDDGWKVDVAREAKRRALAAKDGFDKGVLDTWKALFDDLLTTGN